MAKKIIRHLPEVFQTEAQRKFFDATFEQLFSEKKSEKLDGYIGRRVSGEYSPYSDYYMAQPTPERTWESLEPMVSSKNITTGQVSNVVFKEDFLNKLKGFGGTVANQDRLFSSAYNTFAPPIDYDKFANYSSYYWVRDLPSYVDTLLTDEDINLNVLGKTNYTYQTSYGDAVQFTNGMKMSFVESDSYSSQYVIQGVGTGIYLVEQISTSNTDPDYLTIKMGAVDGNAWSFSNYWVHGDVVAIMNDMCGTAISVEQAKRPIIEFENGIELFNHGTRKLFDVERVAGYETTPVTYASLNGALLSGNPVVDGMPVMVGDTIIFISDNSSITYNTSEAFIAYEPGYDFILDTPFTDSDSIFSIVKRPIIGGYEVFYNPDWYAVEDQDNIISFTTDVINNTDESFSDVGTPFADTFSWVTANITELTDIQVFVGNVIVNNYSYSLIGNTLTVVFDTKPANGISINVFISDRIFGLVDGTDLLLAARDQVEIFVNGNVEVIEYPTPVSGAGTSYIFNTNIVDVTSSNIIGVKVTDVFHNNVYDYVHDTSPSDKISGIVYSGTNATITFVSAPYVLFGGLISDVYLISLIVKDPDTMVYTVKDYVWKVSDKDSAILLLPYPSSQGQVVDGDSVTVTMGDHAGNYYFKNGVWVATHASGANIKRGINQAPLFNLYYTDRDDIGNPISLDNQSVFPSSSFNGSEIFSYKIDPYGFIDRYLGIQLEYKNLGQTADIVFENDLETNRYDYSLNDVVTEIDGYYYFKQGDAYCTAWKPSVETTKLRIIDRVVTIDNEATFVLSATPVATGALYDVSGVLEGIELVQGTNLDAAADFYISETNGIFSANMNPVIYPNGTGSKGKVIEFRTFSEIGIREGSIGYYEIPKQLENNPCNEEVTEYSANELLGHFGSAIRNQIGFEGSVVGDNNYRDTLSDRSLGDIIINTDGALSKAMFHTSSAEVDLVESLRFSGNEYIRFKDRLVKTTQQMVLEGWQPVTGLLDISDTEQFFNEVISRIANTVEFHGAFQKSHMFVWGKNYSTQRFTAVSNNSVLTPQFPTDNVEFVSGYMILKDGNLLLNQWDYVLSGGTIVLLGDGLSTHTYDVRYFEESLPSFVPSSTAKTGCTSPTTPSIVYDVTYVNPVYVIIGHDGSKTPMMSEYDDVVEFLTNGTPCLDKRDVMLLEMEKRVYNSLALKFVDNYIPNVSVWDLVSGEYRVSKYSETEFSYMMKPSFNKWHQRVNANYKTHFDYDLLDWMTWNYRPANPSLAGHWKGVYLHFYDCVQPGVTPWEMLGFTDKPLWWDTEYTSNYGSSNTAMWSDIASGIIRSGVREGVDIRFVRAGMVVPVDTLGENIAPHILGLVVEPTDADKSADWIFGDISPVEYAWVVSSEYKFSMVECLYIMSPGKFGEMMWDCNTIGKTSLSENIYVDSYVNKRGALSTEVVHGETLSGNTVVRHGYQRYVSDYVFFRGMDITSDYADRLRGTSVKLGHRLAGFVNSATMRVMMDGTSTGSTNTGLVIPENNVSVTLHTGSSLKDYVCSGVMVRISETGMFQVNGYDVISKQFKYFKKSINSKQQNISIGGTATAYQVFKSGNTYLKDSFVQYNNSFYQSKVTQTVSKFSDGQWNKKPNLPVTGGVSLEYYQTFDTEVEYVADYGDSFADTQSLFDFLVGYGAWLEHDGWAFDNVDTETGVVQDWLTVGKDVIFWTTSNWSVGNSIFVSAGSERLNLVVEAGYPDNIEMVNNGAYSVIDSYGYAISPANTIVNRDGKRIEVSHKTEGVGIYGLRVSAKETEHVIILDNVTEFNDVIYEPVLCARQDRVELRGERSAEWYGKCEASGYLIKDGSLVQNCENLASSIKGYYREDVSLDNKNIEDISRHLIGYQRREYLDELRMFDDSQYSFYKGMISEKGTIRPVSKILRSSYVTGESDVNVYEEWALKLGEFGHVDGNQTLEFLLSDVDVESNTQMVKLSSTSGPTGSGSVYKVILKNAVTRYVDAPIVTVSAPQIGDGARTAIAMAQMDADGYIVGITIQDGGYGYVEEPSVIITYADGNTSSDSAIALIRNSIDVNNGSDIITIDIDDSDKWLVRPRGRYRNDFIPTLKLSEVNSVVPNAGYVHLDDVDYQSFSVDSLFGLWSNPPTENDYVWVAKISGNVDEWDVFKITAGNFETNSLSGMVIVDGDLYRYDNYTVNNEAVFGPVEYDVNGDIINIPILDGGTNYVIGDVIEFSGAPITKTDPVIFGAINSVDGYVTDIEIVYGGKNYQVGDPITLSGSDSSVEVIPDPAQFGEVVVIDGSVASIEIINRGDSYEVGDAIIITSEDIIENGNSAVVTPIIEKGLIIGMDITDGGTMYKVGDPVVLSKGTSRESRMVVSEVDASGAITAFEFPPATTLGNYNVVYYYAYGVNTLQNRMSFSNGGKYDGLLTSSWIGTKIRATNGVNIDVELTISAIHSASVFGYSGETGSASDMEDSFGYPNKIIFDFSQSSLTAADVREIRIAAGDSTEYISTLTDTMVMVDNSNANGHETATVIGNSTTVPAGAGANILVSEVGIRGEIIAINYINGGFNYNGTEIATMEIKDSYLIDVPISSGYNIVVDAIDTAGAITAVSVIDSGSSLNGNEVATASAREYLYGPVSGYDITVDAINEFGEIQSIIIADHGVTANGTEVAFAPIKPYSCDLYDEAGNVMSDIDVTETDNLFFKSVRFKTIGDAISSGETKYWVDVYGTGWYFTDGVVVRTEESLVNSALFKPMTVYDPQNGSVIANVPVYDPFKGIIPAIADRNITYKSDVDPSRYTNASSPMLINKNLAFGPKQVGQLWWDLNDCRYIHYEQGGDEYRRDYWGRLFNGSKISIYEWVKSDVPPIDYVGDGTPRNETDFVLTTEFNSKFGTYTDMYYFWVVGKNTKPDNLINRTLSAANVARIITNPTGQGYNWYSFASTQSFMFSNLGYVLKNKESILQINYNLAESDDKKHVEWCLVSEGNPDSEIKKVFWDKLVDSLCGSDIDGNMVPDPYLSTSEMYGIGHVPRQGMFADVYAARRVASEAMSRLLNPVRVKDIAGWSMSSSVYWEYIDWFEDGYSTNDTVASLQIASGRPVGSFGPAPAPVLSVAQTQYLKDGDIVKIYEENNSSYYEFDGNVLSKLVRREKTSVRILDTMWTSKFKTAISSELRELLSVIYSVVMVGDNKVLSNLFYFSMLNYVASEQSKVDWFFKTTYLKVSQTGVDLFSQGSLYKRDRNSSLLEYINEIKPYQTKIRDFGVSYDASDIVTGTVYDFDSLSYTNSGAPNYVITPIVDPAFNPSQVRRDFDIYMLHDDVQAGFIDKEMFVELGGQSRIGDGNTIAFVFDITPANYNISIDGHIVDGYVASYDIATGATTIAFAIAPSNNSIIRMEEYLIGDGTSAEFTFKSIMNVDKLFVERTLDFYSFNGNGVTNNIVVPNSVDILGVWLNGSATALISGVDYTATANVVTMAITPIVSDVVEVKFVTTVRTASSITSNLLVPKTAYAVARSNILAYWITVTFVDIPMTGDIITVSSGVRFTHSGVEEMRLAFNTHRVQSSGSLTVKNNTSDMKMVEYDLPVSVDGSKLTGWGSGLFGEFEWGIDGNLRDSFTGAVISQVGWNDLDTPWNSVEWNRTYEIIPFNVDKSYFMMVSGQSGRFIHLQHRNLTEQIKRFVTNGGAIKYSSYCEELNPVSPAEADTLNSLNALYKEFVSGKYLGTVIDAKEFTYLNTGKWDSNGWSAPEYRWDAQEEMPTVTPEIDSLTTQLATFTGNGVVATLRVPYIVTVVSVSKNSVVLSEGVDYTVTQMTNPLDDYPGSTMVVMSVTPAINDALEVVYTSASVTFANDGTLQTVDGLHFVPNPVDNGVTEEMAIFDVSEGIVITYTDNYLNGVRMLLDEMNQVHVTAIDVVNTTVLTDVVGMFESTIPVADTSIFQTATSSAPGVAWIGSERIEYTGKTATALTGVRRRTLGTTTDATRMGDGTAMTVYPVNKKVYPNIPANLNDYF